MFAFGQFTGSETGKLFPYSGIEWTTDILLSRLLVLLAAVALVALASLLFDRSNPARPLRIRLKTAARDALQPAPAAEVIPVSAVRLTPLSDTRTGFRFAALFAAELKLFLKGQPWWWYAAADTYLGAATLS